ncbi:hypothetical protein BD777DRAFT_131953 [Yarrowia lipolytica]|nr:hypothetical protein BD777DRAFT_131953 [Yarrowia lipolytica]
MGCTRPVQYRPSRTNVSLTVLSKTSRSSTSWRHSIPDTAQGGKNPDQFVVHAVYTLTLLLYVR